MANNPPKEVIVYFRTRYSTYPGQMLFLIGDHQLLGSWSRSNALQMSYVSREDFNWECEVHFFTGSSQTIRLEYKYIVISSNTNSYGFHNYDIRLDKNAEVCWDTGPNRSLILSNDQKEPLIISTGDLFQPPISMIQNLFFKMPFTNVIYKHEFCSENCIIRKPNQKFQIRLRVIALQIPPQFKVYITGSLPLFQNWEHYEPLTVIGSYYWEYKIDVADQNSIQSFDYKYLIMKGENNNCNENSVENNIFKRKNVPIWEQRNNRKFSLPQHQSQVVIFYDWIFQGQPQNFRGAGLLTGLFSVHSKKSINKIGEFPDIKLLVDWAVKANLLIIQLLPIQDTICYYAKNEENISRQVSAFAFNPMYLALRCVDGFDASKVEPPFERDFLAVTKFKREQLRIIFDTKVDKEALRRDPQFVAFVEQNLYWLPSYCKWCQIRDDQISTNPGVAPNWPPIENCRLPDFFNDPIIIKGQNNSNSNNYNHYNNNKSTDNNNNNNNNINNNFNNSFNNNFNNNFSNNFNNNNNYNNNNNGYYYSNNNSNMNYNNNGYNNNFGNNNYNNNNSNNNNNNSNINNSNINNSNINNSNINNSNNNNNNNSNINNNTRNDGNDSFVDCLFHCWVQYQCHLQLSEVSKYASSKRVVLSCTLTIGQNILSSECWARPNLFDQNYTIGAPPDIFSFHGQNWFYPAWRWDTMKQDDYDWLRRQLRHREAYFQASTFDHPLGFFRCWNIPSDTNNPLFGHFVPSIPIQSHDLYDLNIRDIQRLHRPIFPIADVQSFAMPEPTKKAIIERLSVKEGDNFLFNPTFKTDRDIIKVFKEMKQNRSLDERLQLALAKKIILSNFESICLILDSTARQNSEFYPRYAMTDSTVFKTLPEREAQILYKMFVDFYYRSNISIWNENGYQKLCVLASSPMQLLGYDLGVSLSDEEKSLHRVGICSYHAQRVPREPTLRFDQTSNFPYLSVCTPSSHDMPHLAIWWGNEQADVQQFYHQVLKMEGVAPVRLCPKIANAIVKMHLNANSMWCFLLFEDLFALTEEFEDVQQFNNWLVEPGLKNKNRCGYRMGISLEKLIERHNEWTENIAKIVEDARRGREATFT